MTQHGRDDVIHLLRDQVGRIALVEGREVQLIEVLAEGPTLVVQEAGGRSLQDNQHGEPGRSVPTTLSIPLLSEVGGGLHPVSRILLGEEVAHQLERLLERD